MIKKRMRIIQKPSLSGSPYVKWYHAQVRRFGFWVDCRDDIIMMARYSTEMLCKSWSTDYDEVEEFVNYAMRGEEMFPRNQNKVVKEYYK